MEFTASKDYMYLDCRPSKKGNGYYIYVVDDNYDKYRFFSKKRFDLERGSRVVPHIELYLFSGRVQFRLADLEVV